jgi:hypothetical protein
MSQSFLVFVIFEPTYCPIGIIESSAPSVKSPMPTIRRRVPMIKEISIGALTGATVIKSKNTIAVTGSTDDSDSFIFSTSIVL